MKLFVQIPCLNEAETLGLVLEAIPEKIKGIDSIEVLVVDDGSTDKTIEVAKAHGVKHFIRHVGNRGLARSFQEGILYGLEHGADIVVNTDGDNQYPSHQISELVQPILSHQAEIVVGDRQVDTIDHFSGFKKLLQKVGSRVVNIAAGTDIPDAASGFRAYSREALMQLNIMTRFSYCMETIIQAGNKQLAIVSIPITTGPKLRESRLFKSTHQHVYRSAMAIIRSYVMYRPYLIFTTLGTVLLLGGSTTFVRYWILWLTGNRGGHLQSLLFGAVLLTGAFVCYMLGVLADLTRINRILLEKNLEETRRRLYQR